MANTCVICERKTIHGNSISRRGMAKIKGGVGKKTTGINRRHFKLNLQRIHIIKDGKTVRAFVCTRCIKAGKIKKAVTYKTAVAAAA